MIDDATAAILRQTEIGPEISAGRLLAFGWRQFADCHDLGGADFSYIEALLAQLLSTGDIVVRDNLADAQMIILEDLEPPLLLDLVMGAEGAPADNRLLVAPRRQ